MKKILSFILAIAVILTSFAGINMLSVSAATVDDVKTAAETYVLKNKNAVTASGLLAAVQAIIPEITLDTANDFYIKHAVPGVKDVMADGSANEYPLNIEGSDGAVAAVFGYGGARFGFTCAFAHEVETIEINEVAVLGVSEGFNATTGDVSAYTGNADKIVIPENYDGSIAKFSDLSTVQQVKVVIVNNRAYLRDNAFENWDGLVAFQMAETTYDTAWNIFANPNDIDAQFQNCDNLKYVKFPEWVDTPSWAIPVFSGYTFNGCVKLENIKIPQVRKIKGSEDASMTTPINYATFSANSVREYMFPAKYTDTNGWIGGLATTTGTRNLHWYNQDMTNIRAVALAMAEANELSRTGATGEELTAGMKSAITGAHNAADVANAISITTEGAVSNDFYEGMAISIAAGSDTFTYENEKSKALASLDVNIALDQGFNPAVTDYTATVANEITAVEVNAVAVDGAVVGTVTGNTNLVEGENVITIPVTTTEGKSVNYTITVTRLGALPEAVKNAAEDYVKANENAVTADGLLAAVQAVDSSITLDTANDFYIKHAVPGVKDNTTEYSLNIAGSDGAVAAIFGYNGARFGFTCAFAHDVETIEISEVAVVGTSDGFTYDENGNVTAYTGTADKIVFPAGYSGTMTNLADKTSVNNVKVLIYNNGVAFVSKAFNNWDGLLAVQIDNGENSLLLASAVNNIRENHMFSGCDNLKYFKFPKKVNNGYYWNVMFPDSFLESCPKLETVIMPQEVTSGAYTSYGYHVFYGSAIREAVWPSYGRTVTDNGECFGASSVVNGTRNIHGYSDNMTFVRAAALAAAAVNEAGFDVTEDDIRNIALNAVTGSADSESFRNSLKYTVASSLVNSDSAMSTTVILSNGTDNISIAFEKSKGLISLNTDYGIEPAFNPAVLNYTVSVASFIDKVNANAVAVDGAVVGDIFKTDGVITVPVTTVEGKTLNYTITVVKNEALDESVYSAADAYVQEKGNKVTLEGLLNAVNTVWAEATITDADFYVKHAVNAVVDNDDVSGYQLSFEGSKGSVTAVIEYQGARYTFNTVFDYQTEVIDIGSYAIVGDEAYAEYFTYDEAGNVSALLKPVEKLIFPVGFAGTMKKLGDESLINADRVKVVIYNNGVAFLSGAFSGWQGLRAVKIDNGDTSFNLASAVNNMREAHMFSYCPNLKYFQFPNKICNPYYWNTMFPNSFLEGCSNLETVIMAKEATSGGPYTQYGFRIFYGTKVQELLMPNYRVAVALGQETFDSSTVQEGTRNIHYYTDEMTYVRAVSLIAAGFNVDSNNVIDDAKALIAGTNDSAQYADTLYYIWKESTENDYITEGNLSVSNGVDYAYIDAKLSKTLAKLTVEKYALDLDFDSEKSEYTVIAPYLETALNISAIAVGGATVTSIDGNIVDNCAEIIVTNTDGKTVAYKINVKREGDINAELISALRKNLLNIEVCPYLDLNSDTYFDIRDLVRAKKMAATPFSNNSENIPVIASTLNGNTETELASVLSYESNNGQITDTLFDGVAFRPTTDWMYIYPEGGTQIRNTTKREWSSFLYNNILQDDYNLPAFEKAAGNLKQTLGMLEYKAAVYLPLMITRDGFDSWGEIDGVALDFTNSADRIAALKWLVDESIAAFDAKGFVNVELCGFYYIDEAMREGDMDILPTVTEYVRSKGLKTFWAPYSDANGTRPSDEYLWDDYGFDEATYQINYFPGREDLPAARDESYIKCIGENASAHGANIEMELCGRTKENISGLKAYLKGGIDYGYMNGDFISWWMSSDCKTVEYLRDSDDAYIRSTYDEMYKFIKKTLTEKEINTVMGD